MSHNITVQGGSSVRLKTAGKYCARDIVVKATGGSGGGAVTEKDVNFYDYDGTLLHSYTVEEAQALTELPELPTQKGLICQGWNWTLESIKEHNRAVNVGAMYITDDGKTRIYIHLEEERKSPMLGCCPNGTVTVDWGDGTEPDVLTGKNATSVRWTPNHEYASGGDYVIKLTIDGEVRLDGNTSSNQYSSLLRHTSTTDIRNNYYRSAVKKVEIGSGVIGTRDHAFRGCTGLSAISIPMEMSLVGQYLFADCFSLLCVVLPCNQTSTSAYMFKDCVGLRTVSIPAGITTVSTYSFSGCLSLSSITLPNGITSIGNNLAYGCKNLDSVIFPNGITTVSPNALQNCSALKSVMLPSSIASLGNYVFSGCNCLPSIVIPGGVTSFGSSLFANCYALNSVVVPSGVTSIGASTFSGCNGLAVADFTDHTAVPILENTNAFQSTPDDLEIRVPAALYDEWIAATNWTTYADRIVAV